MDTTELLGQLTTLPQLTGLVQAFGHSPAWQEIPPRTLPVAVEAAALLGTHGRFEWVGVLSPDGELCAKRLSAGLARQGRNAGVMALDPAARRLTLALTVEQPSVLTIALDAPTAGQLERLRRLAQLQRETGVGFAIRAIEVLTGEDAGRRFFIAFRTALESMAGSLPGRLNPDERRTVALVQLTRVLFLYFVQAKGWLDRRPDFLRRSVDDALAHRRQLHRDLFRPLFFGTLNREVNSRGAARRFGRIPFLNGGLFEPHPLERGWRQEVANQQWQDAFDQVFERFQFTVHEGGAPGQIAPDMLGRVFEGLMAPEERHHTGAFYTPARLVARVVEASLASWLSRRLEGDGDRLLTTRDPRAIRLVRSITVLDPAVGSGAFLLGMLDRLAELRQDEGPQGELRRTILRENLFGVDRNPMAVRLAELRLWLAVIAHEESDDPEMIAPLPNLDGVVRQGDSLFDPAWFLGGLGAKAGGSESELATLRSAFVGASGPAKRECARRLRQREARVFRDSLTQAEQKVETQLTELLESVRGKTLFGERRGWNPEGRKQLKTLRLRQREIRRLARQLRREGEVPWFRYECHFGDVLTKGGFDLVVGNPPWVRAEALTSRERGQLSQRYRCWRGSGPGFAHQPDLAVAFIERGLELLAPGGVLALLVPGKLTTASYATRLRADLAQRCSLERIVDLGSDPEAAFEATTYPTALLAAKCAPSPDQEVNLQFGPVRRGVPQSRLAGGGPWVLASPELLEIVDRLKAEFPRLGERFTPQLGLKTGANALFLNPPPELESSVLRSALRGRDTAAFTSRGTVPLFFPYTDRGDPFDRLPPQAAAYVQEHEALLRARVDYQGGPLWTLFRVRASTAAHRVIWPDLARRLSPLALSGADGVGLIPLNSCYVLPVTRRPIAFALTAWLNTTWIRAVARATADAAASGFARFNARVVSGLPLPATVLTDARLVELAERGAREEPIQEELDAVAAQHLGLTPADRRLLASAPGTGADHRGRSADRDR